MPETTLVTLKPVTVAPKQLRELCGRLVDTVTNAKYMRSLGTDIGRAVAVTVEAQLGAEAAMLAIVLDNAVDSDALKRAAINAFDSGELTRSQMISLMTSFIAGQLCRPALREEFTFITSPDASRCATDLRNRGFKVGGDLTGRTLVVETPAGWTGTPAREVVAAHEPKAAAL